MINISKIIFPLNLIAKGDTVLITGFSKVKKYIDNKPTDQVESIRYACVAPMNHYEGFNVKIQGHTPIITDEELEAKGGSIKVKLKGFEGKFYLDKSGKYQFTSTATGIEVIA